MWTLEKVHKRTLFVFCVLLANLYGSLATEGAARQVADTDVELICPEGIATDIFCVDCFTQAFCDGQGNSVYLPCPPSTPYCRATVGCATEREPVSAICDDQILEQDLSCTGEGYFPDTNNCQKYYICPDPRLKPAQRRTTYECPQGYVYDSVNFKCKKKLVSKDCVTVQCSTESSFVTYPANENYYGFCKTAASAPLLFKCDPGHHFNPATLSCEFQCPGEGYFGGPKCHQYYLCYKASGKLVYERGSCPGGYLWSATTKTCQKDTTGQCSS